MLKAVVYSSETGSCRKYAELLADALGIPACSLRDANPYRNTPIIYIGWLMAGKVVGLKEASKAYIVKAIVQVGMAPVTEGAEAAGRKKNQVLLPSVGYFCKQGGFDMSRLPGKYRPIMKVVNKVNLKRLAGKTELTPQEEAYKQMATNGKGEPADWDITDIIEWLNSERPTVATM